MSAPWDILHHNGLSLPKKNRLLKWRTTFYRRCSRRRREEVTTAARKVFSPHNSIVVGKVFIGAVIKGLPRKEVSINKLWTFKSANLKRKPNDSHISTNFFYSRHSDSWKKRAELMFRYSAGGNGLAIIKGTARVPLSVARQNCPLAGSLSGEPISCWGQCSFSKEELLSNTATNCKICHERS